MPNSFCAAVNTFTSMLVDTPVEACKTLCSFVDACIAFEHNQAGECHLYQSNDFSLPFTANEGRTLYIGYQDLVNSLAAEWAYRELTGSRCFNATGIDDNTTRNALETCESACSKQNDCVGYQFSSGCYLFIGLPSFTVNWLIESTRSFLASYAEMPKDLFAQ